MKTYVKEWMDYLKISIEEVTTTTTITERELEKILTGERNPNLEQISQLSFCFNVTMDELTHRNPMVRLKKTDLFQKYFQTFLKVRGFTVDAISTESNIDPIIIRSWLDGARIPSLEEFIELSDTLQINMDELMGKTSLDVLLDSFRKMPKNQFIYETDEFRVVNRIRTFFQLNHIQHTIYMLCKNVNYHAEADYFIILYYDEFPLAPEDVAKIMKKMNTKENRKKENESSETRYEGIECIERPLY